MRDITGFEGLYQVTEGGQVWSIRKEIFLKPSVTELGYLKVELFDKGYRKNVTIHRLVALHYLDPMPEDKPLALHKDGNKLNCHYSNLYWGDHSDNGYDATKHGAAWQKNKTHCPIGHLLKEPNLKPSLAKKGFRTCRSCWLAKSYAMRHKEHDYIYWANELYYPKFKPT